MVTPAWRFAVSEHEDPRIFQSAYTALFAWAVLAGLWAYPDPDMRWVLAGTLLVALVTVVVIAFWASMTAVVQPVVPAVDILGPALVMMGMGIPSVVLLVCVPALWLAWLIGLRGVLVAAVVAFVSLTVPDLLLHTDTRQDLVRSFLAPGSAIIAGATLAFLIRPLRATIEESERRRTELADALRTIDHERRFNDAILDTVDVGLVLLGPDGRFRKANRKFADFGAISHPGGHHGYAGETGAIFAGDGSAPLTREELPTWRAALGEEFDDARVWIGHDPSSRRALSVSARAIHDHRGTFSGAALTYNDVTELLRALKVKSDFVTAVSHELRTPLTSIAGYTQILLEEDEITDLQARHVEVVARNTDRLARLVSDLLQTGQLEEGEMPVVRRQSDFARIVEEAVTAARTVAETAGIELQTELPTSVPCELDAQRMAQVVDNLLSNAIKYSHQGGQVKIRLEVDGPVALLTISDTGLGISARDRERLFHRFFRAREVADRSIQGIGLGLTITKAIIEAHGGHIEVDSEQGVGSEFRVRVPLRGTDSGGGRPDTGIRVASA